MPIRRGRKPPPPPPPPPPSSEPDKPHMQPQCMRCNAIFGDPFPTADAHGEQVNYVDETGAYEFPQDAIDAGRDPEQMSGVTHGLCPACRDRLDQITAPDNGMTTEERRAALVAFYEEGAARQRRALERGAAYRRRQEERQLRESRAETERQRVEQERQQAEQQKQQKEQKGEGTEGGGSAS